MLITILPKFNFISCKFITYKLFSNCGIPENFDKSGKRSWNDDQQIISDTLIAGDVGH